MNTNERNMATNENEQCIRPFDEWTIAYVRRMVRDGVFGIDEATRFATAFGDGLTVADLMEGK